MSLTKVSYSMITGSVVNVLDYGAIGNGVANDTAAITAAVTAAPAGSTVYFPVGTYRVTSGITDGGKAIMFAGQGNGSIITGGGFAILSLTAQFSSAQDLKIVASSYSANTIGIDVANGTNGVDNFTIRRCTINGFFQNPYAGKGIRMYFGIKGAVHDCVIQFWSRGLSFEAVDINNKPNANSIIANKVRQNITGVYVDTVDDLYLAHNTFESDEKCLHSVGMTGASTYVMATNNHFESSVGTPSINVLLANTSYHSFANVYYAADANCDIFVDTSPIYAGTVTSYSDYIQNGVHNSSSNPIYIQDPLPDVNRPVSGAGKVIFRPQTNSTAPTLLGSWVNVGSFYEPAKYYKDGWNRVFLSGMVKSGTASSTVFTLPVGFRPANVHVFIATADNAYARVNVSDNGNVDFALGTATGYLSLDGISFLADQ
jgi:hypothetical protein